MLYSELLNSFGFRCSDKIEYTQVRFLLLTLSARVI